MLNLNADTFSTVVDQAIASAAGHPRWQTAITRAVRELLSNPWIERDAEHGGLIIGSGSGQVYSANGTCQCKAYEFNQACWHRAASRLVRRHDEAQDRARKVAAQAQAQAELDECFA